MVDAIEFYFDDMGEEYYELFRVQDQNVGENMQHMLWDHFDMKFSGYKGPDGSNGRNYIFKTNLLNGDCLSLTVQGFMSPIYRVSTHSKSGSLDVVWNYDFRSTQIIGESLGINNRKDICFTTRDLNKAFDGIKAFIDHSRRPINKCARKQK